MSSHKSDCKKKLIRFKAGRKIVKFHGRPAGREECGLGKVKPTARAKAWRKVFKKAAHDCGARKGRDTFNKKFGKCMKLKLKKTKHSRRAR